MNTDTLNQIIAEDWIAAGCSIESNGQRLALAVDPDGENCECVPTGFEVAIASQIASEHNSHKRLLRALQACLESGQLVPLTPNIIRQARAAINAVPPQFSTAVHPVVILARRMKESRED